MKFNIKKVATVLGSALMLGSTVALAAAANLPSSFTNEGVALVYGTGAANSDLAAVMALTANLAPQTSTTTSSTTVSGGDSYTFEKSTQKLWIGNGIADIRSSLNDEQMSNLLASGKFLDVDSEEYDYNQKIEVANLTLSLFSDSDYLKDTPTIGFRVASGEPVLNYTLEFDDQVAFNKLETTDLPIMGKSYYVLDVSTDNKTLTLLDSADTLTISEGEAKTVTVNGKPYEISLDFVSETKAKFTVNGQTTNNLAASGTQKLTDGAYIGVKDIMYSAKDTGVSKVEFSIGSGKLIIDDGSEVQMNDEVITDLYGFVVNSSNSLDKVVLQWKADGDQFIVADKELTMPGFKAVKFSFGGVSYPKSEKILVEGGTRDSIVLSAFPLKDATSDISLVYSDETNIVGLGTDADAKLITGTTSITFDANSDLYFVGSWSDNKVGESLLLRAANFRTVDGTDRVTIQQYKDGAWSNAKEDRQVGDEFSIGNLDLNITSIDRTNRIVGINNDGNNEVNFNTLYSKEGLKVTLPIMNGTTYFDRKTVILNAADDDAACAAFVAKTSQIYAPFTVQYNKTTVLDNASCGQVSYALVFTEEDEDGQYSGTTHSFNLTLGLNDQSPKRADVEGVNGAGEGLEIGSTKVDQYVVRSALATDIKYDTDADQNTAEITYHGDESFGALVIASPSATVTAGSTGSTTSTGVMTVSDAEVSSASSKNLIVIGGSCVNSVAAELLGGAKCGDSFTTATGIKSGEAIIKSFARSGKIALLVAGYNGADTTNAVAYLSNNAVNTTVGAGLKVASATSATAITA